MTNIYSLVNITIPTNERIIVVEPNYIRKLVLLLSHTPPRIIGKLNVFKNILMTIILNILNTVY